ncbi:MAG: hypothetical protein UV20_C0034G0004 [Candidatus Magasanikbacteria bacterium GW2011_GWA2_42_32]|uniref:Uncharacterized protein n=1 Tax=Candidatus Magasanikbacteria bacterium GW2011_GWA2_42_32 TaxID=1619039 RepID=A0A0G1C6R5_9BACT|nr:MAG: hypothetical protein UV20_C0034G0004 [Candidatus Magasanikbacteria bacterium GW2011_GWA2_42_32]
MKFLVWLFGLFHWSLMPDYVPPESMDDKYNFQWWEEEARVGGDWQKPDLD